MERKHVDFVSSVVLLLLSIYIISESIRYYNEINQRIATTFHQSPGFFTMIIGSALLICSVLLLIRSLRGGAFGENISKIRTGAVTFVKSPVALKALIGCTWMGVYIFVLLPAIGFVAGSILFLVLMMIFLQVGDYKNSGAKVIARKIIRYLVISSIAVGATAAVFQGIFRVPLP